jgi:hypothetical protein
VSQFCLPQQLLARLTALAITLFSHSGYCQVQMKLQAPPKVEVGQQFEVALEAQSEQGGVANPKLSTPPGMEISQPRLSTSTQTSFSFGFGSKQTVSRTVVLGVRWTLRASRIGKYNLGPAVVELEGAKYQSRNVTVEVVPQGSLPQRQRSSPFGWLDPFDPFGGRMPNMDDLFGNNEPEVLDDYPKELETPAALDPVAFLRMEAVPTRVFVGQQVTLKVFAYGSRGRFEEQGSKEPSRTDFFSVPVVEGLAPNDLRAVPIGDSRWYAGKVREILLFPLRVGELPIGPMEYGFGGGRYGTTGGRPLSRTSQPLTITVAEPPLDGRPSGYQLGDVGRFSLSAEVSPREVEAGGSVSAVVTLSGVGNLPQQLRVPGRTGVDFLTPSVKSTPRLEGGAYGGTKVFTYVIRLDAPGDVDLGEITLPFFDPETQQYDVARTVLGTVKVKPSSKPMSAQPSAAPPSGLDQLLHVLTPRPMLASVPGQGRFLADRPMAGPLLVVPPLSIVLLQALLLLQRRFATWLARRRSSYRTRVNEQLNEAGALLLREPRAAASALERALYLTIEARFQIKGRGVLRPELARLLEAAGVPPGLSQRVTECLEACDSVRFAPLEAATMAELQRTVQDSVEQLFAVPTASTRTNLAAGAQA